MTKKKNPGQHSTTSPIYLAVIFCVPPPPKKNGTPLMYQNMAWFMSNKKRSFLRIPASPLLGENEPFIESSQAIEVHRFERKLNILVCTTALLSLAVVTQLAVVIMRDFRPHAQGFDGSTQAT